MAGNVKSLQALFDKLNWKIPHPRIQYKNTRLFNSYHDRVVKQSSKRRLKLDKGKLQWLLKQRHSHVSKKYLPSQKELNAEGSSSSDEIVSKVDDRNSWKSKHKYISIPQKKDEVQCILNDETREEHVSETLRSFKRGNEQRTSHTLKGDHYTMGKGNGLDQQCEERNICRIYEHSNSHVVEKKLPHKAGVLSAECHTKSAKKHKPRCSSLFSTSHAGPVRKSIVVELQ